MNDADKHKQSQTHGRRKHWVGPSRTEDEARKRMKAGKCVELIQNMITLVKLMTYELLLLVCLNGTIWKSMLTLHQWKKDCSQFGSSWIIGLSVGNRSDFQTPSSQTCGPQAKRRWTSIPLTRQRSLCIMLAAAATTAAYRKFTTLAVRHRKLFCAWNAIFAARWVLPACAAAAVHSDVSNSRHVAKHRVNSAAVWRDPLCHQMMKCLAWSTCASWTASPESAAAWGLVTWRARRCRGARNLPLTRFSTSKLNFCMQILSSLWSKAHFGDGKPQGF